MSLAAVQTNSSSGSYPKKLPPMLQQYVEYKEKYSDCLIFFQVGDFYELFFDDAVTVSQELNLTLTSRDKNSPNPIPMCGVPIAVIDNYVERLVDLRYSVALISQCSLPQPGKGMVDRKLDRIITPAVRVTGGADGASTGTSLASVVVDSDDRYNLVFGEVESGVLHVRDSLTFEVLQQELARIAPEEVVFPRTVGERTLDLRTNWVRLLVSRLSHASIKYRPEEYMQRCSVATRSLSGVKGYGSLSPASKKAVLLFVNYLDETTVEAQVSLTEVQTERGEGLVEIDATSRRNLELLVNDKDRSEEGSLFHYMNRCMTAGGRRVLREWILAPLSQVDAITARQEAVCALLEEKTSRTTLRDLFRRMTDLQRLATRIELGIVSPRELSALREALTSLPALYEHLAGASFESVRSVLGSAKLPAALREKGALLEGVLVEQPPVNLAEGGVFRPESDSELARYCELRSSGGKWMAELELKERESTGISSLKVKFNNAIGYFIEITKANVDKAPEHYHKRQTMTNASRYTTPELKEREEEILSAKSKQIERERHLYQQLLDELRPVLDELRSVHSFLSHLDALTGLAQLAEDEDLTRPVLSAERTLSIKEGKHPVLGSLMEGQFVPNSLEMDPDKRRFLIITGPNMGGKSTYLRQAALIIVMAQVGSFVPAREAHIGVVDKVFARLGASDDMLEGESTFMVEMREAALITSAATDRSFVLIDEIGRGTATADGLALAHAIVEWLTKEVKCRTLFATHFHELTSLETELSGVYNLSVGSVDRGGKVFFTHQICGGPASRSYGIEVARLAGLPDKILSRARQLNASYPVTASKGAQQQLDMFSNSSVAQVRTEVREPEDYPALQALRDLISEVKINETTPVEALMVLEKLTKQL